MTISEASDQRDPTPDRALNSLTNLLNEVINNLTLGELYAKTGRVSQRFLDAGAAKAVCVTENSPSDKIDKEGMIWLPMNPVTFMEEERVQEVGLIYSSPPEGFEQNREIIDRLREAKFLQDNSLVILEEPAWNHTQIDDYEFLEKIKVFDYDRTKITVCQMVSAMEF